MACCNPFFIRNKAVKYSYFWTHYQTQIPCRCCLNCRVDKRNLWSDRCKYEYSKKLSGSFVTLTYDDLHIEDCLKHDPIDDSLISTLEYCHVRRFIDNLRHYINYHPELHGPLCRPDFSYIYVGEYGENGSVFDRCHFHILFFGLDFAFMRNIMTKIWKFGFIDVLPILDGGINYVLKYMDKQVFGELAEEMYDKHLLARPAMYSSKSFGSGLFHDNIDDIVKNNFTYNCGRGKRRPVPTYYKNLYVGHDFYRDTTDRVVQARQVISSMKEYHLKDFSAKARDSFKLRHSLIRERKLRQMCLADGIGVMDFISRNDLYYSPQRNLLLQIPPDALRWLANEYRSSIDIF